MFADKQLKERFIEFCRWLATPPPIPSGEDSADWYVGLCVDPYSFSDQLGKLQNSLRPAQQKAAESVIQSRASEEKLINHRR
jgi:hypothetical protein